MLRRHQEDRGGRHARARLGVRGHQQRLETIRTSFGTDFLTVVSQEGLRWCCSRPYRAGDFTRSRIRGAALAEGGAPRRRCRSRTSRPRACPRAFLVLKTPHARRPRRESGHGPADRRAGFQGPPVAGGGLPRRLLNRNEDLVDRMTVVQERAVQGPRRRHSDDFPEGLPRRHRRASAQRQPGDRRIFKEVAGPCHGQRPAVDRLWRVVKEPYLAA